MADSITSQTRTNMSSIVWYRVEALTDINCIDCVASKPIQLDFLTIHLVLISHLIPFAEENEEYMQDR